MADTRRFRRGHIAGLLFLSDGCGRRQRTPPTHRAPLRRMCRSCSPPASASEFGFTLGEFVDPKRSKFPAPKPQDNGNLYFVLKLAKPSGPFEQVVVGLSPKSQLVLTSAGAEGFSDACCLSVSAGAAQCRHAIAPGRDARAIESDGVLGDLQRRAGACDTGDELQRQAARLLRVRQEAHFSGVTESSEMSQASAAPAAQR